MFEKASRLKLRFESYVGLISTEDLWDLPLTSEKKASLDAVAKVISRQLKETAEESFVVKSTPKNDELQLKLDIVKHVIDVKLAENEAVKNQRENKEKKDRLLSIIAKKKDEQLEGTSLEELQAMVASL